MSVTLTRTYREGMQHPTTVRVHVQASKGVYKVSHGKMQARVVQLAGRRIVCVFIASPNLRAMHMPCGQ